MTTETPDPPLHDLTHDDLVRSPRCTSDWAPAMSVAGLLQRAIFWGLVLLVVVYPCYVLFLRVPPDLHIVCEPGYARREAIVETRQRNVLTQATSSVIQLGYACQPE